MADAIQTSEVIAALQRAQEELRQAVTAIGEHNQDPSAHPIILRLIQELKDSEAVFSRAQVRNIAEDVLKEHTDKDAQSAHGGLTATLDSLTERTAKIEAELVVIKDRLNGTADAASSKLERAISAVENKYAPVLESLQSTLNDAEQIGDRTLADSVKAQISETLSQKRQEIIDVIERWSQEQRGE